MTTTRGRVRVEVGTKRVRAMLGGRVLADSIEPRLVWEVPYYPAYYLPAEAVGGELRPTGEVKRSPSRGDGLVHDVVLDDAVAPAGALTFPESPIEELRGLVRLDWDAMDAWFEEDVEVIVHPRDPGTRVDVLPSSRHVEISVDGVALADSIRPTLLFETGLPKRLYLPKSDVRMDLLVPTDTTSACPYKGVARWWSVELPDGTVHPDLAWSYPAPLPESAGIDNLVAFYDERVDVVIDGEPQDRPRTKFA
ncbi:MAG: DUF427 domain-containing protein [Actinomycetota bacterium]